MNLKESKRQRLLTLINRYLTQSNIRMKYVLKNYQKKLIKGSSLTERELSSITPLLVWDLKMNPDQVRIYFSEVVKKPRKVGEITNTLEDFFV